MSEIDLEAALRAARERCARAAVVDIRALADALDHLIALARGDDDEAVLRDQAVATLTAPYDLCALRGALLTALKDRA